LIVVGDVDRDRQRASAFALDGGTRRLRLSAPRESNATASPQRANASATPLPTP
jgi:hypothetical protein